MIEHPLPDIDAWVLFYSQTDMPVLQHTKVELEKLRDNAECVNARFLAAIIMQDPLMTLRVLAYLEENRRKSQRTDITTIERALMMIGVGPFFRDFDDLPTLEDHLKANPKALLGALKVITRARKAAHWARDWALVRHDLDIDEITVATLLQNIDELLMWCFAPSLAGRVAEIQQANPTMRSAAAQTEVYGFALDDLQMALVHAWHLPQLLTQLLDSANAENPRIRNITLAVDLARHAAKGWTDPALPDDFKAIEELLHIRHEALMHKLGIEAEVLAAQTQPPA